MQIKLHPVFQDYRNLISESANKLALLRRRDSLPWPRTFNSLDSQVRDKLHKVCNRLDNRPISLPSKHNNLRLREINRQLSIILALLNKPNPPLPKVSLALDRIISSLDRLRSSLG